MCYGDNSMGFFSWLASDTGRSISNCYSNRGALPVYLLVPNEFGGEAIYEEKYDGYGEFGGCDVYELVAKWNRKFLASNPDYIVPHSKMKISEFNWYSDYANLNIKWEDLKEKLSNIKIEIRLIGIDIACYDEDNIKLPFPIKLVEKECNYDNAKASINDDCQGFFYDDCDELEEEW